MKHLRHLLPLILLLPFAAGAAPAEPDRPWYEVEIVVFANHATPADAELWPEEPGEPDWAAARELVPVWSGMGELPKPFQRLAPAELQLVSEVQRLQANASYEPLLHLGWRQPGLGREEAVAIRLDDTLDDPREPEPESASSEPGEEQPAAADPTSEVAEEATVPEQDAMEMEPTVEERHRMEGTVRIILSRYLHVEADLLYREELEPEELPAEQQSLAAEFELDADQANPLMTMPQVRVVRMSESRRMRSSEVHYLDHPLFGMLVTVRRYEMPEHAPLPAPAPAASEPSAGLRSVPTASATAPAAEPAAVQVAPANLDAEQGGLIQRR